MIRVATAFGCGLVLGAVAMAWVISELPKVLEGIAADRDELYYEGFGPDGRDRNARYH